MRAAVHQPDNNQYPGIAVLEVYGLNGTHDNALERLKMVANLAGVPVVGFTRRGVATTTFDLGLRNSLKPARFDRTVADQLEETRTAIDQVAGNFDRVAGHGMSAGGAMICALAKLGLFNSGVLLRDALDLRAQTRPENWVSGTGRFMGYQIWGEKDKPSTPENVLVPPSSGPQISSLERLGRIAVEMLHYAPLMLSTYTAQSARELASNPALPLYVVSLEHTFTGPLAQARSFSTELTGLRSRAFNGEVDAPIRTDFIKGAYHSELVSRPQMAAHHIRGLLELAGHSPAA